MKPQKGLSIALAGPIASGKSSLASVLESHYGFRVIRTRDILAEYIGAPISNLDDATLQKYGAEIMTGEPALRFCHLIADLIQSDSRYVIDSIRPLAHLHALQELIPELKLVYVQSHEQVRKSRYLARQDRDNSLKGFAERTAHPVEREVESLIYEADLILNTKDSTQCIRILKSFVYPLLFRSEILYFQEVIDLVRQFHELHGYCIGRPDMAQISLFVGLMVEELGEIHECFSKGVGDIMEEHADLLYLLIGSIVSMGADIEDSFVRKHAINMQRPRKSKSSTQERKPS